MRALKTVARLVEHLRDFLRADGVALSGQSGGELANAQTGPSQWGHWIAARARLDEGIKSSEKPRVVGLLSLSVLPGRRAPPSTSAAAPDWISAMPALIVVRERLVAAATAVMPPWPSVWASVGAQSRKRRSSRRGLRISTFGDDLDLRHTPNNHETRKRPT